MTHDGNPQSCRCGFLPARGSLTRRSVLAGGVAAVGLNALALPMLRPAVAQGKPQRIDVHHHVAPPPWLEAVKKAKLDNPPIVNWSVEKSLEDMDKAGIATAVVSPTTPQVNFLHNDKETAARIARESNEYVKKMMGDHAGRFGMFAMLPLPHIDASLKEIAYVFDTLKADGIGTMTSYGDKWLGYPEFAPVWEELNRRKATVYTHPTTPNCCVNLVHGVSEAAIEFGTDSTRTIASLLLSGTSQRYKDINWIFSHGGGALTAVAERFQIQIVSTPPYKGQLTRNRRCRAQPFLLRHRADLECGHDRGAGEARSHLADRFRHRFPLPHRHRSRERALAPLLRRRACRYRPRQRAAHHPAPEDRVSRTAPSCRQRGIPPPARGRSASEASRVGVTGTLARIGPPPDRPSLRSRRSTSPLQGEV